MTQFLVQWMNKDQLNGMHGMVGLKMNGKIGTNYKIYKKDMTIINIAKNGMN